MFTLRYDNNSEKLRWVLELAGEEFHEASSDISSTVGIDPQLPLVAEVGPIVYRLFVWSFGVVQFLMHRCIRKQGTSLVGGTQFYRCSAFIPLCAAHLPSLFIAGASCSFPCETNGDLSLPW